MVVGKGFTSLHHKLDALLHAFWLELGGEQQMLAYNKRVISCCSDQGVEFGIAVSPMINLKSLVAETAAALDITFDIPKSHAVSDKKAQTFGLSLNDKNQKWYVTICYNHSDRHALY